jgi:predicted nucleic acid-binding protein
MKGYLLDSNVLSELEKPHCDEIVRQNFSIIPADELFISALSFYEIGYGIENVRHKNPARAAVLDRWLKSIHKEFEGRIYAIDEHTAETAGRLCPQQVLPPLDSFIAATALIHDLCVVTRNVRDFARSGVAYLNPFDTTFRIHN